MPNASYVYALAKAVSQDKQEVSDQIREYLEAHLPATLNTFLATEAFQNAVDVIVLGKIIESYATNQFSQSVRTYAIDSFNSNEFTNKVKSLVNDKEIQRKTTLLWSNTQPSNDLAETLNIELVNTNIFAYDHLEFVYSPTKFDNTFIEVTTLPISFDQSDYYTSFSSLLINDGVSSSVNRLFFRKCVITKNNNKWFLNIYNTKMLQDSSSSNYNTQCILLKIYGVDKVINI